MDPVRSPQDVYASHVSSSRGYPIWTPESSTQLLSYHPEGLKIGDVGVVVPEHGNFDVFFNLCLPVDDPFHKSGGVPDGFTPLRLDEADIKTVTGAEGPGQVITGTTVKNLGGAAAPMPGEVPRINPPGATPYNFNLTSTEGALLVLPEGADRHDIRDPRPFFDQASRHAAAWYQFAQDKLGRIISHDAIYVITGFHKSRSWGFATYENDEGDDFPARFTIGAHEGDSVAASCGWETTRNTEWRIGPLHGSGLTNQTVFIRGFKIAVRHAVQGVPQKWVSFHEGSNAGESWLANAWRGISKTIGISPEVHGQRVEISRIPGILPVFHPSDVINRLIFRKEPSAKVAITHDSDWGSMLDKGLLRLEDFVKDELVMKAISEKYHIVSREGVGYLQSKNGSDPLTDENEAVSHPEPLSVVSQSVYRCIEESADGSAESHPTGLQSIPSKFGMDSRTFSGTLRPIKIIVMSDYVCAFCYICDKVLQDAIVACQDLPIQFDVEFRPFTLVNPTALPADQTVWRNPYLIKRFGKEEAEMKLKAVYELSQKAGLKLADDSIVAATAQAHRLAAKAYKEGGQDLQNKFNTYIFEACLAKKANLNDEVVLVDAAVSTGLMNKEEAVSFLRSSECLECVEKTVEAARARGITGVPFVVIDGKWAVNGLQPVECFIQIFRKLAHLPPEKVPAAHAEVKIGRGTGIVCRMPS